MGANRILKKIAEIITSIIISLGTVVFSLWASLKVADLTKGRNYSDVGIDMYTHAGRALVLGLFSYLTIIVGVFVIVRFVWKSRDFMYVYGVVNLFLFFFVWFIFMIAFG